ncbi:u-box domain-containing protein [Ditylenchus destructor]|nr:u-box domain-containing protein [Ditylenchus destructor]
MGTAAECKERGNKLYQAGKYEDALSCYSKAIDKNSSDPSYFTNRALCYLNLKKWDQAAGDCRKALDLDKKNIKANYFLGKTCLMLGDYDEAIKMLARANDFAMSQKLCFGDEITQMMRNARREKFRLEEEKRITQEIELQSYLNQLIDDDVTRKIDEIQARTEDRSEEAIEERIDTVRNEGMANKDKLNKVFAQVDDRRQKREIPDYLCGKISFELMKDPVITPSGITYDRADIKEHLQRVGHFDPLTRVKLTYDQLIPNLAMKEVLDIFLTENEWALDV